MARTKSKQDAPELTLEEQKKIEEKAKELSKVYGPAELYEKCIEWFLSNGAMVLFDYNAKLQSFHSLYKYRNPENLPGLNYPKKFKALIPVDVQEHKELQQHLLNDSSLSEELREFFAPLLIYRSGRCSDITDHALGVEALKAQLHNKLGCGEYPLGIATNPDVCIGAPMYSGVRAYVPELHWFDEDIQKLHFEDIIKIFPPAEAQMMKLIIGRAAVGRTGNIHPISNKKIVHGFRKAGVIIGAPGIGKTITLNGILDALKYLGYDTAAMSNFGSRFNQGNIVTSHLAYNDDLTLNTLEKMLNADSFKSIVTSGTVVVENKGIDAIETVSNTVIIANCNEFRAEIVYNLDTGAISRFSPIATYKPFELREMSEKEGQNLHPASYVDYLAEKYNTVPRVLYIRAIKDCVDYFFNHTVETTGIDVHFHCEKIIPSLRIQIHKNILEIIIRYMFLCYFIRTRNLESDWLPELTLNSLGDMLEACRYMSIDMNAYRFRSLLKEDWIKNERGLDHYWWSMRKILITSLDKSYKVFAQTKMNKDVTLTTEEAFKNLRLNDGFAIGHKMTYITRLWEQLKGERHLIFKDAIEISDKLRKEAKEHENDPYSREYINQASLDHLLDANSNCNTQYLYDPSYDPSKL